MMSRQAEGVVWGDDCGNEQQHSNAERVQEAALAIKSSSHRSCSSAFFSSGMAYIYQYFITLNCMALQQELFRHITTLEAEHQLLKHEWGHAKEEMTEVCLRLGYKKWAAFLEDVRANRLTKVTEYLFNDTIKGGTNMAMSHKKTQKKKQFREDTLLAQVTEGARNKQSDIESPIQNQSRIKHIKGNNSSSVIEIAASTNGKQVELIYPQQKGLEEESISQMLQLIDRQSQMQTSLSIHPFDTFRKPQFSSKSAAYALLLSSSRQSKESSSMLPSEKTVKKKLKFQEGYRPIVNSRRHDLTAGSMMKQIKPLVEDLPNEDQYLLAIENTKLRRKIADLQDILYRGNYD